MIILCLTVQSQLVFNLNDFFLIIGHSDSTQQVDRIMGGGGAKSNSDNHSK